MYQSYIDPTEIGLRWDGNYYDPDARLVRQKIRASGNALLRLNDISDEMFCGPFGSNLTIDNYMESGLPIIRPVNLSEGFSSTNTVYMDPGSAMLKGLKLIDQRTLLFARVGDPVVGKLPSSIDRATISPNIIAARISDQTTLFYLLAFFSTVSGTKLLNASIKKVTQPTVGTGEIGFIDLPIPSKALQIAIGNHLAVAELLKDRSIFEEQKLEEIFPKLPKSVKGNYIRWIPPDDMDSGRIEAEYYDIAYLPALQQLRDYCSEIRSLGEITKSMRHGGNVPNDYSASGKTRLIRGLELLPNRISRDDKVFLSRDAIRGLSEAHYAIENDILITRSGTVGVCAVVGGEENASAFGSFIIAVQLEDGIEPEYVCAFLNSPLGQIQFRREENGAVQLNINNEELARIKVPILPAETRKTVVNAIRLINEYADRSEYLVSEAIRLVENLIEGNLDVDECLAQGRELAEEFGLERP